MNHPQPGDYIDIHTHGSGADTGIFAVENLMAHEELTPLDIRPRACTYGIHPWHLSSDNIDHLIEKVKSETLSPNLVAVGEAGYDKLRGPSLDLQTRAFEEQVTISEKIRKPLFIHCVRAWDELLPVHKRFRPIMPWLVHGFRGNPELARQLLAKGMYLSFWCEFVLRPESSEVVRSIPKSRIFLETDGSEVGISRIYEKVASDLTMSVEELKSIILSNYYSLFNISTGKP